MTRRRRKRSRRERLWRRLRWPLLALGVLLAVAAVDAVVQYLPAVRALTDGRDSVLAARAALTGDLAHLDPAHVATARADLERAAVDFGGRSAVLDDGMLAHVTAAIPGLGGQVQGARALRHSGAAGVQVGLDLVQIAEQLAPGPSAAGDASASPLQRVVGVATGHQDELARTQLDLAAFSASLNAIPPGRLLGPLDRARTVLIQQGRQVTGAAGPGIGVLQELPRAIGSGTHRYLVLLENPAEERPGGGYIGAVGEADFTDGALSGLTFASGETYSGLTRSIATPAPLKRYLFHNAPWELADANWSPDYPTAAAQVEQFYSDATGRHVDGVLSIDPIAVGYLLTVLGPIQAPPFPQLITSTNTLLDLNYIANQARPGDPGKVFLPALGRTAVDRVFHAPLDQLPRLATVLQQGARQKHLVLWFHDPGLEKRVDDAGYAGRVGSPIGDSLLVDDANLAGTKGDLFVDRTFALEARVGADGQVEDQLTLKYHNPPPATAADAVITQGSGGEYRDYLRVYVPETAQLQGMTVAIDGAAPQAVSPEAVTYELGREAIAYWLIVPRGSSATVVLRYAGPFADISRTPERYSLNWEKQVNALPWQAEVRVAMPGGATVTRAGRLDSDWSIAVP